MADNTFFENDRLIRSLLEKINENPEAQFLIGFRGRSLPASFSESYEESDSEGRRYMVLNFWDGNTGNLFDVDYRLVPEEVYMDGKKIDF